MDVLCAAVMSRLCLDIILLQRLNVIDIFDINKFPLSKKASNLRRISVEENQCFSVGPYVRPPQSTPRAIEDPRAVYCTMRITYFSHLFNPYFFDLTFIGCMPCQSR
jgi:hypothetical protein